MRILALDPSETSCGFAVWGPDDDVCSSGAWELGSEFTLAGDIFARLHEKMTDLHMLGRIEAVYFERPRHLDGYVKESNTRSHLIMVGLTAHILSWVAAMDGVRIVKDVHMATWRGHFIGSMPRATKSAQLKEWAMRRAKVLGFRPAVHDQAEAIGILDYACEVNRIMPYWRQHEVLRPSLDLVM